MSIDCVLVRLVNCYVVNNDHNVVTLSLSKYARNGKEFEQNEQKQSYEQEEKVKEYELKSRNTTVVGQINSRIAKLQIDRTD